MSNEHGVDKMRVQCIKCGNKYIALGRIEMEYKTTPEQYVCLNCKIEERKDDTKG